MECYREMEFDINPFSNSKSNLTINKERMIDVDIMGFVQKCGQVKLQRLRNTLHQLMYIDVSNPQRLH